jgi:hypothetical protein
MSENHTTDEPLTPELERIATAAAEKLRDELDGDTTPRDELRRRVADAAGAAIASGVGLAAIADAERAGQQRARHELGPDALRNVTRAARRKREAETEYEQHILRAARLGLSHREIAGAANVAHGTIRAILSRTDHPARRSQTAPPDARSQRHEVIASAVAV